MRRIGILSGTAASDPEPISLFVRRLQELGWTDGKNLRIDYRWAAGDVNRLLPYAAELVGMAPDIIFVQSNPGLAAVRQATRIVPTVFVQVADPVGSGFVESLARPGGNITGFANFEASMGGKWLETLKEIAPQVKRALILMHPETAANVGFLRVAEAAAPSLGVKITAAGVHDAAEIERAMVAFGGAANGGLVAMPHTVTVVNNELIIRLASRYRLPAIYAFAYFAKNGGLLSYGVDAGDLYKRAADYVDRILKGAKPGDLPVQAPNKFELVINSKAAKALGLAIPRSLLMRADEVIE